jgi:hypothetical protein
MTSKQRTRPPCMVKIFSSIMAAMGRQLKQSVKVFHNLMLYRRLPVCQLSLQLTSMRPTLVVEPVDPIDTGTLVVTSEDEKVFRVLDLVCQEQTNSL